MSALVVQADANRLPLADATVDLVVTSPPYFALRSYQDGGEHYAGQVGDEASPQEFVASLLAVTAECARVLKPSGSIWVNLGDKYGRSQTTNVPQTKHGASRPAYPVTVPQIGTPKSLLGMPWRYALGCIDQLGLILRAEVIWSKPNPLPESVTDRVRRSHETWFHFTKEPRYFSAVDEIRESFSSGTGWIGRQQQERVNNDRRDGGKACVTANPLGKAPGSVWTVATEPLNVPARLGVDHFAAFPTEWPRRIVQGWSPSGICTACGEGRRPTTAADRENVDYGLSELRATERVDATGGTVSGGTLRSTLGHTVTRSITGYACACAVPDAPTRPAVVIDCFGGTGTTALVASTLGRVGISFDLSHDYSRLARWRTTDPGERAKAMRVDKPPVEVDGQADLFGGAA